MSDSDKKSIEERVAMLEFHSKNFAPGYRGETVYNDLAIQLILSYLGLELCSVPPVMLRKKNEEEVQ